VIADGSQLRRVSLRAVQVVASQVDIVVLEMAFDMSSCRLEMTSQLRTTIRARDKSRPNGTYMNMQSAKVLRELLLLLGTYVLEILIAEDDDTSLRDKQSKFVLLGV
jgi:hypothetical protein